MTLFLFATVGGFSTQIAYLITPSIRAWGRTSIVFLCLSVLLVGWLISQVKTRRQWLVPAISIAIVPIALLDQSTTGFVPRYDAVKSAYRQDKLLTAALEKELPRDAALYQLPHQLFPEEATLPGQEGAYDNLRGYLHSTDLRWAYPSMKGRPDDFVAILRELPHELLPASLESLGYSAVWIDRRVEEARDQEELFKEDHELIAESKDGNFAAYRLRPDSNSAENAKVLRDRIFALSNEGIEPIEHSKDARPARWLGKKAVFQLESTKKRAGTLDMRGTLASGLPAGQLRSVTIAVDGKVLKTMQIDEIGTEIKLTIPVKPNGSKLVITSTGPAVETPPSDPRQLYTRWIDPMLIDTEARELLLASRKPIDN
jgi:hypothetical protein